MSTTINSTNLDFESIKANLKTFFKNSEEFKDYNFTTSGLNNLLDVLAWNTHYNALTANFSLNEAYLNTAQLRSSVISAAENVGYIPKSKTASRAVINLSATGTGTDNITLPIYSKFTGTLGNTTYTFQTLEPLTGVVQDGGGYVFENTDGDQDIFIYEGILKTKTFIADEDSRSAIYIIPDQNLDIETVQVKVYSNVATSEYQTYINIKDADIITEDTSLYILKESPNGYYELSFSDGSVLGQYPSSGYKIEVEYLSTSADEANNIEEFAVSIPVQGDITAYTLTVTTESYGGSDVEDIESIRKNAPFQYAAQNRMVTAADYASLILRNHGNYIKDIKAYGGEDALLPEFGAIYISIVFDENVSESKQDAIKAEIVNTAASLAVASFRIQFINPSYTRLHVEVVYDFDSKNTTTPINLVTSNVKTAINNFMNTTTGKFGQAFRKSNLLTEIDAVSPSILSSTATIKMEQRLTFKFDRSENYTYRFPVPINRPDDEYYMIKSNRFYYNGKVVYIRNRLSSNILEMVLTDTNEILIDNIGYYNPVEGIVYIVALKPTGSFANQPELRIVATPANQGSIIPIREDILLTDSTNYFATPRVL